MKLDGIRVIDLSLFLPGPHLTMMMADHGADVICVEPPGGEPTRQFPYSTGGSSVWFRNTHRGKRSVSLDLKTEAGRQALLRLCDTADVVLEAFRPGVVDRLGVGYAVVSARNPRVVYASIAAFGQTGPLAQRPAHDLAIEAMAGIVSLNLGNDGQPVMPHMPVADMAGSLMALSGILMALLRRERTGQGDYLDISMQDAAMAWLPNVTGKLFAEGRAPEVKQERSFGGGSFNNIYRTRDGRHLVLGGSEPKFVERLLTKLDRPDLIAAASSPAGPAHAPVKAFLSETFLTRSLAEWLAWLDGIDICYAPVLDLKEAFAQPQVAAREMLVRDADGNQHIGIPIRFRAEPGRIDPRLPSLGEHTAALCDGG
jgi:crotonobetainyl-CoA:carnitine CoA-transferase CaiB-like acyl-CoA transferase